MAWSKSSLPRLCIICGNMNDFSFYCEDCERRDWHVEGQNKDMEIRKKLSETLRKRSCELMDVPDVVFKAASGKAKDVERLIMAKANAYVTDKQGNTALSSAVLHGHREVVKVLASKVPDLLLKPLPCKSSMTCLQYACILRQTEMAQILLKAGGKGLLHLTDERGATCLHYACEGGSADVVRLVLHEGGVELLLKADRSGVPPLRHAIANGFDEAVIALLLEHSHGAAISNDAQCVFVACQPGRLAALRRIAAAPGGAAALRAATFDANALNLAAHLGNTDAIRILLAAVVAPPASAASPAAAATVIPAAAPAATGHGH